MRDACALGLGELDPRDVLAHLLAVGRRRFGADGEGVVRVEALGVGMLLAGTRALGQEPAQWRAITAPVVHPGPGPTPGAKRTAVAELEEARTGAERAGADEALLFDAAGRLVEGARTNLALALTAGGWVTPPAARGAVRGVALAAARAAGVALVERDVSREELCRVREIVATNAVRGARPIVSLDGRPVGDALPGPLQAALAAALAGAG